MPKQKNKKSETGITLIALVVTIIVLIILAGVSIAMLVGDNGIITQAQRADELTTQAQQKEAIELAIASVQAQGTLELDRTKLETALQSQLGDTTYTLTENGDGSFLLQIAERSYYIDSTGEVITQENMIAIDSAEELKTFRDDVNSGNSYEGKYVYLTSDITLDSNEEWEPIGNRDHSFKGIFNGNKFEISGIFINTPESEQGLFGYIDDASILNLGIGQNCYIIGGRYTAGIVGTAWNGTRIINCYNKTNIEGNGVSGGIAGQLTQNGLISQCHNAGTINVSGNYSGGICGSTDSNSIIEKCYNTGNVIASNNYAGGIVGCLQTGTILQECYNTGNITGNTRVGGICGEIFGQGIKTYVKNTYNIGNISGTDIVYGISYCWDGGTIENSFYLENTVNDGNDSILNEGSSYMSSNEIKQVYSTLGEAFKQDTNNINQGYPILAWQ